MRRLANLFLILFILSAVVGLAAFFVPSLTLLADLQRLLSVACLLLGVLVYMGFGFNRYLPLSVFVPPLLWLLWSLGAWWPLELTVIVWGEPAVFVAQLLVAMIVLKINFLHNGCSLLLVPEQFDESGFGWRRLTLFGLLNILIIPLATGLILFFTVSNLLHSSTGGFVSIRPDGLYMTEKIYHRADKQIRLAGMIHLGKQEYYRDLLASIPAERTLILAEGVSDNDGLMQHEFRYDKVADLLGLTAQEHFSFAGRVIGRGELEQPYRERYDGPHILAADIDLKQFDPRTVEVLNALARYVLNADSLVTGYFAFNRWIQQNMMTDIHEVVMGDLIVHRNAEVIGLIPQALNRYDILVIPWGALHMKEIEGALIDAGFYLVESRTRRSISFIELPVIRMITQLRNDR